MLSPFTTTILAISIFTTLISAQSSITSDLPSLPGPSGIHGGPPERSTASTTTTAILIAPTDIATVLGVTGRVSTTGTATATDISTILGVTAQPSTSDSETISKTKSAKTTVTSNTASTTTDVPTLLGPSGIQGGPGKYSSMTSGVVLSTITNTTSTGASTSASASAVTTTTQLQTSTSTSEPASTTSLKPYAGAASKLGAEIASVGMVGALVMLVIQ